MATTTFDTLKFANTLKAAGVPDKQAEAQASVLDEMDDWPVDLSQRRRSYPPLPCAVSMNDDEAGTVISQAD